MHLVSTQGNRMCAEMSRLPRPGIGGGAGSATGAGLRNAHYQPVYDKKRLLTRAGEGRTAAAGRCGPVRRRASAAHVRFPPRLTKFLLAGITSGAYDTIAPGWVTQRDYHGLQVTGCNPIKH